MSERMSSSQIVYAALVWAEESMEEMVRGCGDEDAHRLKVAAQLKQLRAYRKKRFGTRPDPLEGAVKVEMIAIKPGTLNAK